MKRKISLLLALVLVLSLFGVGCSKPQEQTGEPAAENKPAAPAEKTFITILTGGSSGPYFALGGAVSNLFNEFLFLSVQ